MTAPCPPPDFETRRPRAAPPPGACDTHAHVLGPAARYPFAANRNYTPVDVPVEAYASMLDRLGVERCVIVQPSAHRTDHRVTIDAIAALGARARGIATVPPDAPDAELATLAEAGFRGVRVSTLPGGSFGVEHLERFAARAAELGWLVQLHLDVIGDIVDIAPRLAALKVPLLVDHLGRPRGADGPDAPSFRVLLDLLRDNEHVWVKICSFYRLSDAGPPYDDMRPMVDALVETRPDRLVWGTNWPHPNFHGPMPNDGDLVDIFMRWVDDPALQRTIMADNAARLFGFG